jgi:RHS repeat-associated protein
MYRGGALAEAYVNQGDLRIARLGPSGAVVESTLFDGVDHPLRLKRGGVSTFFELDLAGNVRRLRGAGGADLGGYRYSAFGKTLENTASIDQVLRWKGRPRDVIGGLELYDMRARTWVPEMGVFLSIDAFWAQDPTSTLWAWPGQSPLRFADPTGRNPALIALAATTILGFGIFAPSDTSQAPADLPGMASSVPGIGPALGRLAEAVLPILERSAPRLASALRELHRDTTGAAKLGSAESGAICPAGQQHHAISRTVHSALEQHPSLAGRYSARDPRFVTRAIDGAAHRGYQQWHRELDREVVEWIQNTPDATTEQFERYLRDLYARPDLAPRFPNGL